MACTLFRLPEVHSEVVAEVDLVALLGGIEVNKLSKQTCNLNLVDKQIHVMPMLSVKVHIALTLVTVHMYIPVVGGAGSAVVCFFSHTVYKGANYNNYYTRRPGTEAIVNLYRVQSVYNNNVASHEELRL